MSALQMSCQINGNNIAQWTYLFVSSVDLRFALLILYDDFSSFSFVAMNCHLDNCLKPDIRNTLIFLYVDVEDVSSQVADQTFTEGALSFGVMDPFLGFRAVTSLLSATISIWCCSS